MGNGVLITEMGLSVIVSLTQRVQLCLCVSKNLKQKKKILFRMQRGSFEGISLTFVPVLQIFLFFQESLISTFMG